MARRFEMTHRYEDTATPDLFGDTLPPTPPPPPALPDTPEEDDGESILLHESASRDYLEYAIAVVKGRALPDVATLAGMPVRADQPRATLAMASGRELSPSAAGRRA